MKGNYDHNFSLSQRNYIYRTGDFQLNVRQLDLAHFSKWKVKDNQSVALGLMYRFRNVFEDNSNELRFTEQYNITHQPIVIRFGHRFRWEQRIIPSFTIHRFRYRFSIDTSLQGEKLDIGEAYIVGNWENLLSVTRANKPQYDQRFTLNLGWLIHAKMKIQFGVEYRFEDYFEETQQVAFFLSTLNLSL